MQAWENLSEAELVRLAASYEGAGNHKDLEGVLRRLMALAPKSADYARRLGWMLVSLERPAEAEALFEKAASIPGKERWEAFAGRGIALALQEKFADAVPLLQKANANGYKTEQTQMYLLRALNDTGRHEEGLPIAESLARTHPHSADMAYLYGAQLRWVGRFAEAAQLMRQAVTINPDWAFYGIPLLETLAAAGDFTKVIALIPQFLAGEFDDFSLHQLWAHALASAFPTDEGLAHLRSLIARDPNDLAALYHLGLVLEKQHDLAEARSVIERCLAINPTSTLVLGHAGRIAILQARYAEAQDLFQKVWKITADRHLVHDFPAEKSASGPREINPILYMPVEIGSRELHTRLIIAAHAVALGFNAVIMRHDVLKEAMAYLPPGLIVYKGISSQENNMIVEAHSKGHLFTVIDEESFGRTGNSSSALKNFDIRNIPGTAAIYGPGEAYCDRVAEVVPEARAKLIPVGNPRTDLYEPKFLALYEDEVARIQQEAGKTILVCTNFGSWNSRIYAYAHVAQVALRLAAVTMDSPRGQWLLDILLDCSDAECRNTQTILAAMEALSAAFPDHKIILRPHPVEDLATWRHLLAPLANAVVTTQASLPAQMMAADVTVHVPGCGTGLEARLLGRPVICINTVKDLKFPKLGISGHLSPTADDVPSLIAMIKQAITGPDTFGKMTPEQEALLAQWITRKPETVSERIAEHLLELFNARSGKKGAGKPRRLPAQLQKELERTLRTAHAVEHAKSFARIRGATQKRLHATPDQIRETIAMIGSCIELPIGLSVDALAEDVFVIGPARRA